MKATIALTTWVGIANARVAIPQNIQDVPSFQVFEDKSLVQGEGMGWLVAPAQQLPSILNIPSLPGMAIKFYPRPGLASNSKGSAWVIETYPDPQAVR